MTPLTPKMLQPAATGEASRCPRYRSRGSTSFVSVALVEAFSPSGSWLGALATPVFWGLLPLSVVMYVLGTPARRRARRAAEALAPSADTPPDGSGMAAGDAVAAERKEP